MKHTPRIFTEGNEGSEDRIRGTRVCVACLLQIEPWSIDSVWAGPSLLVLS